jgi:hypothetical protein
MLDTSTKNTHLNWACIFLVNFMGLLGRNALYGRGLGSRMLMFFNRMVRSVQLGSTANYFTMTLGYIGYIGYMYGVGLEILLTI